MTPTKSLRSLFTTSRPSPPMRANVYYSCFIPEAVSSIIHRGPHPKQQRFQHRSVSNSTEEFECVLNNGSTSPGKKEHCSSQLRSANTNLNHHRCTQSVGSLSTKRMMAVESACSPSSFSAVMYNEQNEVIVLANHDQAKETNTNGRVLSTVLRPVGRQSKSDRSSASIRNNFRRIQSGCMMRQSTSANKPHPLIVRSQSFDSAQTTDSSLNPEVVSSIINRGPKPKHHNFFQRRVKSETAKNSKKAAPDDAIIIDGKVIECKHRNEATILANKKLSGSRPKLANSSSNCHISGSCSVSSVITEESDCSSHGFSTAGDDKHTASDRPSSYHKAKKNKSKKKNVVAEEMKYKMKKMGNLLSALILGEIESIKEEIVLTRAKDGHLV